MSFFLYTDASQSYYQRTDEKQTKRMPAMLNTHSMYIWWPSLCECNVQAMLNAMSLSAMKINENEKFKTFETTTSRVSINKICATFSKIVWGVRCLLDGDVKCKRKYWYQIHMCFVMLFFFVSRNWIVQVCKHKTLRASRKSQKWKMSVYVAVGQTVFSFLFFLNSTAYINVSSFLICTNELSIIMAVGTILEIHMKHADRSFSCK